MALILTEEKMDKATRVIFKCGRKACKHVWAIEYTHKRYDSLYRVENDNQIWRTEDYHCPKCNDECYVKATNVVGVYNEKHACNARCMSSTSGACSCSCGGANHGAGHLTVQEHIIEVEETAQEPEQVVETVNPTIESITPEQMAALLPFAQEYSEHKRIERETFAAESALETVPMEQERLTPEIIQQCITEVEEDGYVHVPAIIEALEKRGYTDDSHVQAVLQMLEARATSGELLDVGEGFYKRMPVQRQEELQHMEKQEREVITVEKYSAFGTRFAFYHPECYQGEIVTVDVEMTSEPHTHVGDGIRCCLCAESVHAAPSQVERPEPMEEQKTIPLPTHYTLIDALNAGEYGCELAVCASGLFIMVVQDRHELGGGYGIQVIALDRLINKFFNTIEQVEGYLVENTPYELHSTVWLPLPAYSSHALETDFLKRI